MAKKDNRVNEYGIDVMNLKPGEWITIRWNDTRDVHCILLEVEQRAPSYKGTRSLKVFEHNPENNSWSINTRADSDQVVETHGDITASLVSW